MTLPSQSAGRTLGWRIHYIAGTVNEFEVYGPDDNYLPDQSEEASLALAEHINGLAAENSKLKGQLEEAVAALEKAADTFHDFEDVQLQLGRTVLAQAARIAEEATREAISKLKEAGS